MVRFLFAIIFLLVVPLTVKASVYLATGSSSVTRGRVVPILYGGYDFENFGFSASSTGVKTDLYYSNYYELNGYWVYKPTDFLGGELRSGVGIGLQYTHEVFRESVGDTDYKIEDSYQYGLAFKIFQVYWESFFFGMENLFGFNGVWGQLSRVTIVPAHTTKVIVGFTF